MHPCNWSPSGSNIFQGCAYAIGQMCHAVCRLCPGRECKGHATGTHGQHPRMGGDSRLAGASLCIALRRGSRLESAARRRKTAPGATAASCRHEGGGRPLRRMCEGIACHSGAKSPPPGADFTNMVPTSQNQVFTPCGAGGACRQQSEDQVGTVNTWCEGHTSRNSLLAGPAGRAGSKVKTRLAQ